MPRLFLIGQCSKEQFYSSSIGLDFLFQKTLPNPPLPPLPQKKKVDRTAQPGRAFKFTLLFRPVLDLANFWTRL
jgi:hypothetical protein